ncbi:MAG: hypothetical protein EB168_05545 [Euryarchaeota archaeon]|nr:hypothetical protein [Euryarchaeota archaeon]
MRTCDVEDCEKKHHMWGYCEMHAARVKRHGDPLVTHKVMDNRGTNKITYSGSHGRLHRVRGKANQYTCVDCGGPAEEWSYNHNDPNELYGWVKNNKGHEYEVPYSADPYQYDPRCRSCHVQLDSQQNNQHTNREVAL